jgi:hypothetical protein
MTLKMIAKMHPGTGILLILGVTALLTTCVYAQQEATCSHKDFKKLEGAWQGSLTYLDYSSGKPYTMPANLEIHRIGKTNQYSWRNIYSNEPKANSIDTVMISSDGRQIDNELVKSKQELEDGTLQIVTEVQDKDGNDNKEALIRHTYSIGKMTFRVRKDVQFAGEANWIMRHEYSYAR